MFQGKACDHSCRPARILCKCLTKERVLYMYFCNRKSGAVRVDFLLCSNCLRHPPFQTRSWRNMVEVRKLKEEGDDNWETITPFEESKLVNNWSRWRRQGPEMLAANASCLRLRSTLSTPSIGSVVGAILGLCGCWFSLSQLSKMPKGSSSRRVWLAPRPNVLEG
jgi:hypothetical protein